MEDVVKCQTREAVSPLREFHTYVLVKRLCATPHLATTAPIDQAHRIRERDCSSSQDVAKWHMGTQEHLQSQP